MESPNESQGQAAEGVLRDLLTMWAKADEGRGLDTRGLMPRDPDWLNARVRLVLASITPNSPSASGSMRERLEVELSGYLNRDAVPFLANRILNTLAPEPAPTRQTGELEIKGDLLRRVLRVAREATVHDLGGIKLVRVVNAVAQQLAIEPEFLALLRSAPPAEAATREPVAWQIVNKGGLPVIWGEDVTGDGLIAFLSDLEAEEWIADSKDPSRYSVRPVYGEAPTAAGSAPPEREPCNHSEVLIQRDGRWCTRCREPLNDRARQIDGSAPVDEGREALISAIVDEIERECEQPVHARPPAMDILRTVLSRRPAALAPQEEATGPTEALQDILCRAYFYDDKPHQLFTAIARAAKGHEDEEEIVRLMMAATESPAPGRGPTEEDWRRIWDAAFDFAIDKNFVNYADQEAAFRRALESVRR
jgi:hypothetical protein